MLSILLTKKKGPSILVWYDISTKDHNCSLLENGMPNAASV